MIYKTRNESTELVILESLNTRMNLSVKDKQHYSNLKKGYEGEVLFDSLTENLECECFILNDLLLKLNNTLFQIDSLIITSETIYLFEVKNFEGDFYFESDRFYKKPQTEMSNPLLQLSKGESLLRQLLQNLGINIPINASVVFINPAFTLYQAPLNKPFILPTQLNSYFKKLNTLPSKLYKKHEILAEKLLSLHINDSPFKTLPLYNYDDLQKGITCDKCSSFSISIEGRNCVCNDCGHQELVTAAVIRSVEEFKLLFPNEKITTNIVHEWCKAVTSKKRIRMILGKNLEISGIHQWAFYE
ncbi:nuclease-related domain-containing protein [Heyndrickxia acidicola]|uniref:Nuclease-related domain-containing protein n=1 Tax=Heyndrickxia acidicola TaxID=209389 RepID=A0ABU6MDM4_9BACI|nr:nuclease-related domain-containing protein [Heyndrickxia acidicola]MED1202767.1 nuclease-related domain-containing protein [Heyndrickxia acidicola]